MNWKIYVTIAIISLIFVAILTVLKKNELSNSIVIALTCVLAVTTAFYAEKLQTWLK